RDVAELLDLGLGNGAWPRPHVAEDVPMRLAAIELGYAVERIRVRRDVPFDASGVTIDAEVGVVGDAIVRIHHGKLQGRHLVDLWVALAVLTLERPGTAWTARLAGYREAAQQSKGVKTKFLEPVVRTLTLRPDAAGEVLDHVLRLRALARTTPIPVFPRATTALALGEVGKQGASGWKFPKEVPSALGQPFGDFNAPFAYDLERGAAAWFFGDATADSLALVNPSEREVAVLSEEARRDACAALAYARELHLTFDRTAVISASMGGAP
ncbi:MAG: hypothetical protein ACKOOG_03655, partial [Actinomycetota bacterium]